MLGRLTHISSLLAQAAHNSCVGIVNHQQS